MMRCDHCQALLLDHLYGLLESADAAAVEEHLAGCANCAAAREETARARTLIARAARREFPNVRFAPPVEAASPEPAVNGVPVTPAAPTRITDKPAHKTSARNVAIRWAVAAAVLVAVGTSVVQVNRLGDDQRVAWKSARSAANRAAEAKNALVRTEGDLAAGRARAADRLAAAKKNQDEVLAAWAAAERAVPTPADRKVTVDVQKSPTLQPGAPNDFTVVVNNGSAVAAGTVLEAEVRDQSGAVLHRQRIDVEHKGNRHPVHLPAAVWTKVKPDAELFLVVATVDEKTGSRAELPDRVRLFGPVYATLLVTDKPAYRPGERVFFRSLTLDRVTLRPPAHEQILKFELRDAKGAVVPGLVGAAEPVRLTPDGRVEPIPGPDGKPVRGVGCGEFVLPESLPDGDYTLTLTEALHPAGYPPAVLFPVTRTVKVRAGAAERFQKKVGFAAASHSAGDTVSAWVELKSADKPVAGVKVAAVAVADDVPLKVAAAGVTGPDGRAEVKFQLPPNLPRGDVRLKVTFATPGGDEVIAERVPVVGETIIVEFFPEGGKLVAGVPNRVYFRATTPVGQPAELRGTVTDGREVVAKVETLNDGGEPGANRGIGSFTFTPKAGERYWLTATHPANVRAPLLEGPLPAGAAVAGPAAVLAARRGFTLPAADADGVVMTVPEGVTAPGQPFKVQLHSAGRARNLVVGAYTRGRLMDTQRITVEPGKPGEVTLMAGNDPRGGVTRITMFEEPAEAGADLKPVAERLVFRKPGEKLDLAVTPVSPVKDGDRVDLNVTATDEKGNPAPAILWAAVTNAAVTAGPRDRLMPTHFLLAGEVENPDSLEYADFLLTDGPLAAKALDLVLATQGWRRFVEQGRQGAMGAAAPPRGPAHPDAARFLATTGQFPPLVDTAQTRGHRTATEAYLPKFAAAEAELAAARAAKAAIDADRSGEEKVARLRATLAGTETEATDAAEKAKAAGLPLEALRGKVWYFVGALAPLVALFAMLAFWVGPRAGLPFGVAALGAAGLAAFLVLTSTTTNGDELGTTVVKSGEPPAQPAPKVTPGPRTDTPGKLRDPNIVSGRWTFPAPVGQPAVGFTPRVMAGNRLVPDELLHVVPNPFAGGRKAEKADDTYRDAMEKSAAENRRRIGEALRAMDEAFGNPEKPDAALARIESAVVLPPGFVAREYAAPRPGTDAANSPDTVFWHPLIVLPGDGKATFGFHVGGSPSGYQVIVAGHTPDGRIGAVRGVIPVAPK